MVELDDSLGLGNRPVWFPSASGGNRPPFLQPIPSQYPPVRANTLAIWRLWTEWVSLLWSGVSESLSGPRSGPSRPEPVPGVESEAEACAGPVMWGGPWPRGAREPGPWGRGLWARPEVEGA